MRVELRRGGGYAFGCDVFEPFRKVGTRCNVKTITN